MFLVQRHMRLFKRFLFLLVPYSLIRVGFYFYHLNIYKHFNQNDIFESLLLGLRFDVSAICLLNIPSIVLALIPSKNSRFLFFERILFIVVNSVGLIASLDDYELYSFMGKRLSFDLFVITDDIWEQLPQLVLNFWYFPLIGLIFGVFFYYFDRTFFLIKKKQPPSLWLQILSSFFLLALSFVAIRGGLQHKSINVQSAFTQGQNELGHLVLNTPYHFLRTLKNQSQKKLTYFKSDDEAINIIMNRRDLRSQKSKESKKNIVLIILESFSLEYVEKGYTPFLSELIKNSLYFSRHVANGRRSIEALPSLLCGLPALLDEPISKSIFQGNKFNCMPKILKSHGYNNYFFHGGAKGTMGFESYTMATGFDRYFSRSDYPNQDDFDGTWGIYDGPFLDYSATEIHKMEQPFLANLFTLSSHQPYSVPLSFKGKFPKGSLDIHESIGYADNSLKLFFEKIKIEPWFLNTIFFITADHASKLESQKFQNLIGHYRVPFLIYDPSAPFGESISRVTQHSDIPKIVLDYVGINGEELPATSVGLKDNDRGFALNYADGREYWMATEDKVVRLSKDQSQKLYNYDWETGAMSLLGPSEDPLLKAYIQYYINGLINNNLSIYR